MNILPTSVPTECSSQRYGFAIGLAVAIVGMIAMTLTIAMLILYLRQKRKKSAQRNTDILTFQSSNEDLNEKSTNTGVYQDYVIPADVLPSTNPDLTTSPNAAYELLTMASNIAYCTNQNEVKTRRNVSYHATNVRHEYDYATDPEDHTHGNDIPVITNQAYEATQN